MCDSQTSADGGSVLEQYYEILASEGPRSRRLRDLELKHGNDEELAPLFESVRSLLASRRRHALVRSAIWAACFLAVLGFGWIGVRQARELGRVVDGKLGLEKSLAATATELRETQERLGVANDRLAAITTFRDVDTSIYRLEQHGLNEMFEDCRVALADARAVLEQYEEAPATREEMTADISQTRSTIECLEQALDQATDAVFAERRHWWEEFYRDSLLGSDKSHPAARLLDSDERKNRLAQYLPDYGSIDPLHEWQDAYALANAYRLLDNPATHRDILQRIEKYSDPPISEIAGSELDYLSGTLNRRGAAQRLEKLIELWSPQVAEVPEGSPKRAALLQALSLAQMKQAELISPCQDSVNDG